MKRRAPTLLVTVLTMLVSSIAFAASEAETATQALASSLGTLSGADAYTTYIALGAVADGWVHNVYPADKVTRIAGVLRRLAEAAAAGLNAVLVSGALREDDRAYVQGMVDAYGLLAAEAGALTAWVQTGERKSFDEARDKAWKLILSTLAMPNEEALE
jgi:hypothetical protein